MYAQCMAQPQHKSDNPNRKGAACAAEVEDIMVNERFTDGNGGIVTAEFIGGSWRLAFSKDGVIKLGKSLFLTQAEALDALRVNSRRVR